MDAKKALRRHNLFRTLKIISYLLGFPLLLLLLMQSAYALGFGVKGYPTKIVVIAWAGVTAVQILVSIITKSYSARAVSVVIVSIIALLGFSMIFDYVKAKPTLNAAAESFTRDYYRLEAGDKVAIVEDKDVLKAEVTYKDGTKATYETPIKSYNEHLSEFKPWSGGSGLTGSINSLQGRLIGTYNINGSGGGNKNTDGTKGGAAPSIDDNDPEYWFGEKGAVYNPNGLYADSYIFGVEQTIQILLTIYRTQDDYKEQGLDADVALAAAYAEAETSPEWLAYKTSDEYLDAYGPNGEAYKYMLTEERLNDLLNGLGGGLLELSLVKDLTGPGSPLASMIPAGIMEALQDLDLQKAADLVDDFGASDTIKGLAGGMGVVVSDEMTTKDVLLKLVYKFCYYQMPTVRPSMYFIKDETLRTYAYAKYFAEIHGYNNACVLYSESPDGHIGGVTMSDSGAPASSAFTAEELCTVRAIGSYSGAFFPKLLVRRYAMTYSFVLALAYLLAHFFAYKQHMYATIIRDNIYHD